LGFKLQLGINDCTNRQYHSDSEFLSSSDLKNIITDPQKFYFEKVLGQKPPEKENPHYDIGSLVHGLILEPHLVQEEFAFFAGLRKQGPQFEMFKQANKGRVIISHPQRLKCEYYVSCYKKRQEAVELIKGGFAEQTICVELDGIKIKVRTDYINVDKGYIADVKTSGFAVDYDSFQVTCNNYMYPLSAALYCKAAEMHYGKKFDFYWIAISKVDAACEVFKMKDETKQRGELEIAKAINKYKQCQATGIWTNQQKEELCPESVYEILEI
jgi:hypothetical protein